MKAFNLKPLCRLKMSKFNAASDLSLVFDDAEENNFFEKDNEEKNLINYFKSCSSGRYFKIK